MAGISFLYPWNLFFLLLIPLFIFVHIVTLRTSRASALKFANFEAIAKIRGIEFFSRNIVILVLSSLVLGLIVLSLAGTVYSTNVETSSYSFVLAVDTSRSMEATDFQPNRMEAAKNAANTFVESLPIGSKVGVVSFSGNVIIESDVSDEKRLAKSGIDQIQLTAIGGTDIYEVVLTSTNLLIKEDARAIFLLSDGQINVGDITESIKYANDNDVIVHTLMVGTLEGGETSYGYSKADADSLDALAFNTNGQFYTATNADELNSAFTNVIDKTEKKIKIVMGQYFLIAAVILFGLEFILINTRFRRII